MGGPPDRSLMPDYFEAVYAANADPWAFETSSYEAAKYGTTLAALPRARYRNAFEIGCSIGVLSERLADRCDRLLAVDVVDGVLERARARCHHLPHVLFERMRVPETFPNDRFDLVLVSEVGYYWSRQDLATARRRILDALEPGGHLLLVHWTPHVHDYPLTGDEVHAAFLPDAGGDDPLLSRATVRQDTYRLDLLERR